MTGRNNIRTRTKPQAANQPDVTAPAGAARARFEAGFETRPWLRWVNQPDRPSTCLLTLVGHADHVTACAFTPDGRLIVSGWREGQDVGKQLRPLALAHAETKAPKKGRSPRRSCRRRPARVNKEEHFFRSTDELLEEYEQALKEAMGNPDPPPRAGRESDLRNEFRRRLRELSAMYGRVHDLNDFLLTKSHRPVADFRLERWRGREPTSMFPALPLISELILFVDCFYFVAWRALEIVTSTPPVFPWLPGIKAVGIRDVRNHLIQHPSKQGSRIFAQSWEFGDPEAGPRVKPFRPGGRPNRFPDRGMFRNAAEFRDGLDRAVVAATQHLRHNGLP